MNPTSATPAEARPRSATLPRLPRDAAALLVLLALALAALAPALRDPTTHLIGWYGDSVQHLYAVGWMAQAPLLGQSPFVDPRPNYPGDLALMATDLAYLGNLAVAPVTWALGPIFSYNLITLLGLFLSGYFTYLWVLQLTRSRAGALAAGAIFLLSPYRLAHAHGHLQLVVTFALPLFFWALDRSLRGGRPWPRALGLAGATFLVGSSSQYYLIICLVVGAGYALLLTLPDLAALLRRGWLALLAVAAGSIASALPYVAILGRGEFTSYNPADTRLWSADPLNFLLPPAQHPLWGGLVGSLRPEPLWIEKTLYVGLVALALALVGLALWRGDGRRTLLAWGGAAALAGIFALGTDLHIGGQPVQAEQPLWLPAYYLGQLPGAQLMRVWARFGVLTILFVALLAGAGVSALAARLPARRGPLLALIAALILLDMAPMPMPTTALGPRAVDRWLADQPPGLTVAAFPPYHALVNYGELFASLYHGHELAAYMHPVHITAEYRRFAEIALRFPQPGTARELREAGIDYLLLDRRWLNGVTGPELPLMEAGLAAEGVPVVADLDGVMVLDLRHLDS